MNVFRNAGDYRAVSISDFKLILTVLDNPYAPWIEGDGEIDLKGYIVSIGGTYECRSNTIKITTK